MSSPRTGMGVSFGPDHSLYVVGGSVDGEQMLASMERLDLRTRSFERLPDMPPTHALSGKGRGYLDATFGVDGLLYVVGGIKPGLAGLLAGTRGDVLRP